MDTDDTYLSAIQSKAARLTTGLGISWARTPGIAAIRADYVPGYPESDLAEWERDLLGAETGLPPVREVGCIMWDGDGEVYAVVTVPGAARIVSADDVTDAVRILAKTGLDMRFGKY